MSRPTIALCMIVKNERKNLPRLFESVSGCFDEICITDTGSTDDTVKWLEENGEKAAGCPVRVYNFEWINSFCDARNYSFSHAKTDYVMWMDGDDSLDNKDAFIKWRDCAMEFADFTFATYHYAVDENKNPLVSFVRERVMKTSIKPTWQYRLHEGIIAKPDWKRSYITTWSVKHLRDAEDIKADRSRNITLLEELVKTGTIDARMQFYYGKELYEFQRPTEAIQAFDKALKMPGLEHHDKILSLQYGGYAAMLSFDQLKDEFREEKIRLFHKTLDYSIEGIKLDANRAEFYVLAGDAFLRLGDLKSAVPYFSAAKSCLKDFNSPYEGAVYSFRNLYGEMPSLQLAKIYAHLGLLDKAKAEAKECLELYGNKEAENVLSEVNRVSQLVRLDNNQEQSEDIVFTCPPQTAYPFDEEIYKTKPLGGSETALVQMARLLREKTGRPVKVFNMRDNELTADSGVEYIPAGKLNGYMSKKKPHTHIAWRHNIKLTEAPTYLWCHDLVTGGVEGKKNFDKIMCLSKFHKGYVQGLQGVSDDQVIVTRNGIDPVKLFAKPPKAKNPNKLVWMSSPDRGLDKAMLVCDRIRKHRPDVELHVYYGLDNLYKFGLAELAEKLKAMMAERPYVKYHGFTEQTKMYHEVSDAVIWIHPCNFIETFCITALEMLALGIYPVTRRLGALANTLEKAEKQGQATMLDHDCVSDEDILNYANAVTKALVNKSWEKVSLDAENYSWDSVANEWIDFMHLGASKEEEAAS